MREPATVIAGVLVTVLLGQASICIAADSADQSLPSRSPLELARRAASEGRPGEALDLLNRAADAGRHSAQLLDLRAQLHMMLGNTAAAERDWDRAAAIDPGAAAPRLALARLYATRGLWPDAVALYREVLVRRPRHVEALLGLVDAYRRSGRVVSAGKLIEAAAYTIDDRRVQERWANVALESGRPDEAERALALVVDDLEGLDRRDVLNRLAALYLETGRLLEALAAAQEALGIEVATDAVTEETYDLLASCTDRHVEATIQSLTAILDTLDRGKIAREEAFSRVKEVSEQVDASEATVSGTAAPESRRTVGTRRLYAYSLASEAVLNALIYVDLGSAESRDASLSALRAAETELRRIDAAAEASGAPAAGPR